MAWLEISYIVDIIGIGISIFLIIFSLKYPPAALSTAIMGIPIMGIFFYILNITGPHIVIYFTTALIAYCYARIIAKHDSLQHRGWITVLLYLIFLLVVILGLLKINKNFLSIGILKISMLFALGVIPFFAGRLFSRDKELLYSFLKWLIITGIFYVFLCLILNYQGLIGHFGENRYANLGNPIIIAKLSGITCILCFCFILDKSITKTLKIFLALLSGMCFYLILITGSRGPFIALIISLMLASLLYNKSSKSILYLAITFLIIVGFLYINISDVLYSRLVFEIFNSKLSLETIIRLSNGRLDLYYPMAIDMFLDSPIFGSGTGGFSAEFSQYWKIIYPHNIFLEILAENGFIGFFVFLLFLCVTAYNAYNFYLNFRSNFVVGRSFLTILIFSFLVAQTSQHIGILTFFWLTCGVVSTSYNSRKINFKNFKLLHFAKANY